MLIRRTFLQAASRTAAPLLALFSLACIIPIHAAHAQETPPATLPAPATSVEPTNATETFADFEGGNFDGWTIDGDAFGTAPATDALFPGQITGFRGRGFLCSLHPKKGNGATGKATSREFTIEKPVIRFKIGGGNHPIEACLNLVVDNQIVRTATGNDTPNLSDASWDVSALVGKKAHLEVVDSSTSAERGYILVDEIQFTGRIDFNNLPYQNTVKQMAEKWRTAYGLPGVWCALIKSGRVVACVAVGTKNVQTGAPADINDRLAVGSVSKVITGALIASFVAEGKISYDTTVAQVFPELAAKYPTSPLLQATLKELLSHTAGLPTGPPVSPTGNGPESRLETLQASLKLNTLKTPGTEYQYSYGLKIAVAMIEKRTGTTYDSWLEGPRGQAFGFTNLSMIVPSKVTQEEVMPHYLDSGKAILGGIHNNEQLKNSPDGGCYLTLADACNFINNFDMNTTGLPTEIFKELCNRAFSAFYSDTAGSWHVASYGYLFHEGNTGRGEIAAMRADPRNGDGFIVYTNANFQDSQKADDVNIIHHMDMDLDPLLSLEDRRTIKN